MMKKLFLVPLLAFACYGQAISSGTFTASATNYVRTNGVQLLSLMMTDTSGAANLIKVYDAASGTNIVLPAYTSLARFDTNLVETFTNMAGVIQSSTNAYRWEALTTNAAITNVAPVYYLVTIPANGTVIYQPTPQVGFSRGVTVTAGGAAAYTLQYKSLP